MPVSGVVDIFSAALLSVWIEPFAFNFPRLDFDFVFFVFAASGALAPSLISLETEGGGGASCARASEEAAKALEIRSMVNKPLLGVALIWLAFYIILSDDTAINRHLPILITLIEPTATHAL